MTNEIFYSALGGALGGGVIVFFLSVIPTFFEFLYHLWIKWHYSRSIDSIKCSWGDVGSFLLPNGSKISYSADDLFQDKEILSLIKLSKDCIVQQNWTLFRRTLEILNQIEKERHSKVTIAVQKN